MFSQYCKEPFTVEAVEVISSDGKSQTYPDLCYHNEVISAQTANKIVGIKSVFLLALMFFILLFNLQGRS